MEYTVEWWRWVLLIILFGGLFGAWWWVNRSRLNLKKMMEPPVRQIKVLERQWVSSQLSLFLIEINGERFLLARTAGSVSWQKLESKKDSKKT